MQRSLLISAFSIVLATACGGSSGSGGDPMPTEEGTGGTAGDTNTDTGGAAGSPDDPGPRDPSGTGGRAGASGASGGSAGEPADGGEGGASDEEPPVIYETRVGSAYTSRGDGRLVLIDATGTRVELYNWYTGGFLPGGSVDEYERGLPLADVVATATLEAYTLFFDASGQATIFDHTQAVFTAPRPTGEVLQGLPLAGVGAAFTVGQTIFVFDSAGTSYSAYNLTRGTWSAVYSFATDFGGGGAPFPAVGAANERSDGMIVLFSSSGDKFTMYDYAGRTFSSAFDLAQFGDGTLDFNDVSNP